MNELRNHFFRSPAPYERSTLNRSPSRGNNTWGDSELAALRSRIAAGVRMSRRATADAPSTTGMADRIGLFSSSHSGSGGAPVTDSSQTQVILLFQYNTHSLDYFRIKMIK